MKKGNIFYFIMTLTILSCSHIPNELEDYINSNYELESNGNVSIDLRKALKTDYDTMYVFDAFTPISVVRSIIGVPDYGNYRAPGTALICSDSEMCKIILTKSKKVVYDDEYYYNDYQVKIDYHSFDTIVGEGIFDGEKMKFIGYKNADSLMQVKKDGDIVTLSKESRGRFRNHGVGSGDHSSMIIF